MITNPIGNPKVAILASLLLGVLAVAAFTLRPDTGQQPAYQSAFGHRDATSASPPDHPPPATLASGKISTQKRPDADVATVLDAVRTSLKRNDLASAKVLLDAEQALYNDDPRILALQRELQAREEANGHALAVEHPLTSPAEAPSPPRRFAARYTARTGHAHSGAARIRERASRPAEYAQSGHALQTEAIADPGVQRAAPVPVPTSTEVGLTSLQPTAPAAEAPSPPQSDTVPLPPTQVVQNAQSDSTWTPPGTSAQAPKTRAQVRMELERARADGALPRFGNPDPAGPGGAVSRTTHTVVLDW